MYNNIRHIYLQEYLDIGNSDDIPTIINSFQSNDKTVNRNFSTFIYKGGFKAFELIRIRNQYYMFYVNKPLWPHAVCLFIQDYVSVCLFEILKKNCNDWSWSLL